ncbi:MAG: hypothetical protein MUD12_07735 [Spirochaetes bacterium]|jgi:hypothetical protein|nr:hypothetical protein [Spirochaetota bacterium]
MNINTDSYSTLVESIQKLNNILKSIVSTRINIDDKMLEADITAKVSGQGEKVDISA